MSGFKSAACVIFSMDFPVILYDDHCLVCTRFATVVDRLAGGRLTIIGHYSELGGRIRQRLLDKSATGMFWVVDKCDAYGGRAALLPLLHAILSAQKGRGMVASDDACQNKDCGVLVRSASLLKCSRHITYDTPTDLV